VSLHIRPEAGGDDKAIRALLLAAFPTNAEAELVRMLHEDRDSEISLVAEETDGILGHVMLSRMKAEGDGRTYRALGLGPVAVVPKRQGQGIGAALIGEALRRAEAIGEEILFVLGEPAYYGRFGFSAEAAAPFASPYAGPHFMAKTFGATLPSSGRTDYAPAFARLGDL
jgi:putative acetyltransferase